MIIQNLTCSICFPDCFPINRADRLRADVRCRYVVIAPVESRCFLFTVSHRIQPSSVCMMTLFVVFAECTLDAQPLNLNSAFQEESLSQVPAGELLPYFIVLSSHFYSALYFHCFFSSLV